MGFKTRKGVGNKNAASPGSTSPTSSDAGSINGAVPNHWAQPRPVLATLSDAPSANVNASAAAIPPQPPNHLNQQLPPSVIPSTVPMEQAFEGNVPAAAQTALKQKEDNKRFVETNHKRSNRLVHSVSVNVDA